MSPVILYLQPKMPALVSCLPQHSPSASDFYTLYLFVPELFQNLPEPLYPFVPELFQPSSIPIRIMSSHNGPAGLPPLLVHVSGVQEDPQL